MCPADFQNKLHIFMVQLHIFRVTPFANHAINADDVISTFYIVASLFWVQLQGRQIY
jgi:hypothetical protein